MVGGVAEARETQPDHVKIVLKNRYGFVRMALKTGSFLVPVFTFGENELYSKEVYSIYREVNLLFKMDRELSKNFLKFAYWKRIFYEMFNHMKFVLISLLVPWKRTPLTTVVGKPIKVNNKIENPSDDEIKDLHQIYMSELEKLFQENKEKYLRNKNVTFEII